MLQLPFRLWDTGAPIHDLHRKLANIKYCRGKLTDASTYTFNQGTHDALNAFKKKAKLEQDGICDLKTWQLLNEEAGSFFHEAWQYELDALDAAKESRPEYRKIPEMRPAEEKDVIARAHEKQLAGLAFSGGGIRSATFNLGILQALAELKLLNKFDYISSVSGGGYISAWFSKWVHEENGKVEEVERKLSARTEEDPPRHQPEEVRFLRKYSNYLAPKTGLFSADTWALISTYFRNTALNLAILTALLAAVLAVPRLLLFGISWGRHDSTNAAITAGVALITALWAVFYIALNMFTVPDSENRKRLTQQRVLAGVVLPLMLAALAGSVVLWLQRHEIRDIWSALLKNPYAPPWEWLLLPGIAYFTAWSTGWLLAQLRNGNQGKDMSFRPWPAFRQGVGQMACAVVGLGVGTLVLFWSVSSFSTIDVGTNFERNMLILTFGPAHLLSVFGIAMILVIGLAGRMFADKSREWWARQGGWTAICVLGLFCLTATSLYGPPILGYVHGHLPAWGKALLTGSWAGAVLLGLMVGRSGKTGNACHASPNLERIAMLAPPLFCVGALLAVSTLAYFILLPGQHAAAWGIQQTWGNTLAAYYNDSERITLAGTLAAIGILAAIGLVLSWRVDINKFSLHMMYRNRLVRAYLGATNRSRQPHSFTGFDEKDDIYLDELRDPDGVPQRPVHIVNTALNLTTGEELAWQTRKAASFSFSPLFCGFELPSSPRSAQAPLPDEASRGCYRATARYRQALGARNNEVSGIDLGMAVAVSGAAVSPNMGYHSSPSLAFLMTLFNVRLGRWFANPLKPGWKKTSPSLGVLHLLAELFGMSKSTGSYFHLSDGGHFENLGIYELVRRRCKLIVAVDASADGDLHFEDLGNAIRKCATDLNIEIDIDVSNIERIAPSQYSKAYCVAGKILYSRTDKAMADPDSHRLDGTLLYIKPCLLGKERADIKNYMKSNKDFPHQSTVDQFFDETQFESYRSLGQRVGTIAFEKIKNEPDHQTVTALAQAIEDEWKTGVTDQAPRQPEAVPEPT